MPRPAGAKTWVEISRSDVLANLKALKGHIGDSGLMAVVKSNAYGHGLVETAKIAEKAGIAWLSVDNVDEGMALRKAGLKTPILLLGYTLNDRLADCVKHGLSFVAYNLETVRALRRLRLPPVGKHPKNKAKAAYVHLPIETGTTRQGTEGDELRALVRALKKTPGVIIEGVSTHYANIEDTTDTTYAKSQLARYCSALELLHEEGIDPPWKHTACSAAALLYPETLFNVARTGIAMYGLWPSKETLAIAKSGKASKVTLKPALTWKTVIAQVKEVKKGTPVSYGLTERTAHDSIIAVIPVGYWDGFDRKLSGIATVLVRGKRCKVMGRICMNMCMIDVTDVPGVRVEDEVVLLGSQGGETVSAEDVAAKAGTINYEIVTRINPTLPRIVVT